MWSGFSAAVVAGGSVFVNVTPPASGSLLSKWWFILTLVAVLVGFALVMFDRPGLGIYLVGTSLGLVLVFAAVNDRAVSGPVAAQQNTVPVGELSEISGISADLFPTELEDRDRVRISPADFLVRDVGIYRGNEGVYWSVEPVEGAQDRNWDVVVVEGTELVESAAETN